MPGSLAVPLTLEGKETGRVPLFLKSPSKPYGVLGCYRLGSLGSFAFTHLVHRHETIADELHYFQGIDLDLNLEQPK